MRRLHRIFARKPRSDERGIAMLAALMCVIVIVSLTVVAVQQSMGSLSGLAQTRKTLQTVDAAEAGLQYEINTVRTHAASAPGTAFNCPKGNIPVTLSQSTASTLPQPNIADPASVGAYTLSATIATAVPTTTTACSGSLTVPTPNAQNQWYALIKSQGTTSASTGGPATGRTLEALVKIDANQVTTTTVAPSTTVPTSTTIVPTYGAMGNFNEALFGQTSLVPGGSFYLTDPSGNNGANAFTAGPLVCGNSNTFQGVLQAYAPTSTDAASGSCIVSGSLFVDGPVALTTGAALYQNVYSTGAVDLNGGFTISGNVYANGNVTVEGGATIHGTIYANGSVTLTGGTIVGGNIFAVNSVAVGVSAGGVAVAGTIESQTGNISYAGTAHSGAAYVSAGHTVTPCPKASAGPTSCTYTPARRLPGGQLGLRDHGLPAARPHLPDTQLQLRRLASGRLHDGDQQRLQCRQRQHPRSGRRLRGHRERGRRHEARRSSAPPARSPGATTTARRTPSASTPTWPSSPTAGSTSVPPCRPSALADGTAHDFYLIVPTQTDGGVTNAVSGGTACPGGGSDFTPADNIGNIDLATNLNSPTTLHDFVYTPNSVCTHGSTTLNGKVYAGGQFSAGGGYNQTWYDIQPYGQSGTTGVPVTTTLPPVINYAGAATAQAANLALLNGSVTVAASATPTQATYAGTGSGSNSTASNQPAVSLLAGDTWLSAGLLSEYAEADTNASSYACAGVLSVGDALARHATGCTITGTGTGGFGLDISKLPGLGTALSSIADVKVVADAATAFASEAPAAVPTGSASLLNAKVVVNLVGGLLNLTVPLTVAITPNADLLSTITSTLGGINGADKALLAPLVSALSSTIAPLVSLQTDYQSPASPTAGVLFAVSALHVALIGTTAVADLGKVTVGPDLSTVAPTTTTTSTTVPATTTTTIPSGVTVVWIKQV